MGLRDKLGLRKSKAKAPKTPQVDRTTAPVQKRPQTPKTPEPSKRVLPPHEAIQNWLTPMLNDAATKRPEYEDPSQQPSPKPHEPSDLEKNMVQYAQLAGSKPDKIKRAVAGFRAVEDLKAQGGFGGASSSSSPNFKTELASKLEAFTRTTSSYLSSVPVCLNYLGRSEYPKISNLNAHETIALLVALNLTSNDTKGVVPLLEAMAKSEETQQSAQDKLRQLQGGQVSFRGNRSQRTPIGIDKIKELAIKAQRTYQTPHGYTPAQIASLLVVHFMEKSIDTLETATKNEIWSHDKEKAVRAFQKNSHMFQAVSDAYGTVVAQEMMERINKLDESTQTRTSQTYHSSWMQLRPPKNYPKTIAQAVDQHYDNEAEEALAANCDFTNINTDTFWSTQKRTGEIFDHLSDILIDSGYESDKANQALSSVQKSKNPISHKQAIEQAVKKLNPKATDEEIKATIEQVKNKLISTRRSEDEEITKTTLGKLTEEDTNNAHSDYDYHTRTQCTTYPNGLLGIFPERVRDSQILSVLKTLDENASTENALQTVEYLSKPLRSCVNYKHKNPVDFIKEVAEKHFGEQGGRLFVASLIEKLRYHPKPEVREAYKTAEVTNKEFQETYSNFREYRQFDGEMNFYLPQYFSCQTINPSELTPTKAEHLLDVALRCDPVPVVGMFPREGVAPHIANIVNSLQFLSEKYGYVFSDSSDTKGKGKEVETSPQAGSSAQPIRKERNFVSSHKHSLVEITEKLKERYPQLQQALSTIASHDTEAPPPYTE